MPQFRFCLTPLCVLALACAAHATTYEVSPGGNDSHTGLPGAPWQTLQKAANTAVAGDLVLVDNGTYAGFRCRTSGSAAARITFKSKNKWGAKITSPDPNGDVDLIAILSASYITIDGFEVSGAPRAGIGVRTFYDDTGADTRDNIVQNCYSHDNGLPSGGAHDGIFTGFALNFTAQDNMLEHNGEHGIYISNSADNPIVRRNVSFNNRSCGIQLNADLNTGVNGTQDGLISNWLVESNVIHDNGAGGGAGINLDGDINGICRNNLIYNNLASGIALYGIDGAQPSHHNLVANNTIYNPASSRAAILVADGAENNVLFNNICYSSTGIEIGAVTTLTHDYNFVSSIDGGALAAHEASPVAASLFANLAGLDFHLAASSPALDSGIATLGGKTAPATDLEGHARPSGAGFDRGCYETAAPPGAPKIAIANAAATEGDSGTTAALFTVALTAASTQTVTVNYATADGTAKAPADYAATSGTLSFTPGQTSRTITVLVKGDLLDEGAETFKINLSNPVNATLAAGLGAGTITDNDPLPSLSISDAAPAAEGDSGSHNALFTITLSAISGRTVTVNYTTKDVTAIAGSDYTAKSGTITFQPGQIAKTLPVAVQGDGLSEANETFKVLLSGAYFAVIADGQGSATINDDDAS